MVANGIYIYTDKVTLYGAPAQIHLLPEVIFPPPILIAVANGCKLSTVTSLHIHYTSRGMEERLLKVSSKFPYIVVLQRWPFPRHAASSMQHTTNCVLTLYLALLQHLFVELLHNGLSLPCVQCAHVSTVNSYCTPNNLLMCNKCRVRGVFSEMCAWQLMHTSSTQLDRKLNQCYEYAHVY